MSVPAPQAGEPWTSSPSVDSSRAASPRTTPPNSPPSSVAAAMSDFARHDGSTAAESTVRESEMTDEVRGAGGVNWRAELAAERSNLTTAARAVIADYMENWGISQAELAKRMGISSNRVAQMLSGSENLTLRNLAAVAAALHARFDLNLRARGD